MINIDTRILEPDFGLNESEMWLLLQIVKRLDVDNTCFPSNDRLLRETGWAQQKLKAVKKSLKEKGILEVEARYAAGRQRSNIYKVKTSFMSVFVSADKLSKAGLAESRVDENHPLLMAEGGGKSSSPEGDGNHPTEVLSRDEVLSSEVDTTSGVQMPLIGTGELNVTKQKKAAHPCYKLFVDHWLKKVHPGWGFTAVDGKAMKQLIAKVEARLRLRAEEIGVEVNEQMMMDSFKHFCESLPDFYKTQTLTVLNTKFDSIMDQIRNGKKNNNWNSTPSARRIIESL